MKTITMIATALVAISASVEAQAYCMQPSAPSCASSYGRFDDEWEFDRCKRDMENFRSEIDNFIQCKQSDINEANDKAEAAAREAEEVASDAKREVDQISSEYNEAVRDFNERAGGY